VEFLIRTNSLSKIYNTSGLPVKALREVNFSVERGEWVSIVGPSGSGKSTLLHILSFLDRPTSGNYFFNGQDVSRFSEEKLSRLRNETVGFVFQFFNLLPRTSALENIILPLRYSRKPVPDAKERAEEALKRVGLQQRLRNFPNQLSGGEQQRVAIARALVTRPLIIFADEPTGNLDTTSSLEIMELLKNINKQGTTVVMVTHDLEMARFAGRLVTMRDGQLVKDEKFDYAQQLI